MSLKFEMSQPIVCYVFYDFIFWDNTGHLLHTVLITWHDSTWRDMTWHDVTWCDMTWHNWTREHYVRLFQTMSSRVIKDRSLSFNFFFSPPFLQNILIHKLFLVRGENKLADIQDAVLISKNKTHIVFTPDIVK